MSAINVPLVYNEDRAYLSLETLCRLYAYRYVYFEETGALLLYNETTNVGVGMLQQGVTKYKALPNGFARYGEAGVSETVYMLSSANDYVSALDATGHLIYLKEKVQTTPVAFEPQVTYDPVKPSSNEPISLTWEAIEQFSQNFSKLKTPFEAGINVVSPTWFNLNVNGILINSAELSYVRSAHENGVKVWGLVKNNFDPDWTHDLLTNEIDQRYAIAQLLFYSAFYELDGINFDFENMYLEDQTAFADFIANASEMLQAADLTVSIDVTRPGGSDQWSKVYDRTRLGQSVDYVCLMAYDEFWGSSPLSGPVASLPWTEESIQMTLNEIPASKILLGVPQYMRVWEETKNSRGTYVKTGSKAITMNGLTQLKDDKSLEIQWDSASEQYYAEYYENDKKYRVWIEDETSMQSRLNLVETYELPGIAAWRRGYSSDSMDVFLSKWLNE
jgi:spore germination protein YaaH